MIRAAQFFRRNWASDRFAKMGRWIESRLSRMFNLPPAAGLLWRSAIVCLLLSTGTPRLTHAAESEATPGHTATRPERDAIKAAHRPWVWAVTDARAKIWLAGCLHMGTPRDAAVFPAYLPFYRKASALYFETLPGSWNAYDVKRLLSQRGMLTDRQSLSAKLSKDTWQNLNAVVASSGGRLDSVLRMEPWLAALTLSRNGYVQAGLASDHSLEAYIERAATQDKKPLGSLETPKDQILAMADASFADQEEFLNGTLNCMETMQAVTETLRDAWVSGEEARLQSALGIDAATARSGMHQNLIGKRNRQWVQRIQKIAGRGKPAVIVVGVEHLVANTDALPHLLKQAGFSVRRVGSER